VYEPHVHHSSVMSWLEGIDGLAYFCRHTQLGFLRLITHPSVRKGDVKSQKEAWQAYDTTLRDERIWYRDEPDRDQLSETLRGLTSAGYPLSNQWPDAYFAAFARVAGLTLVTFDRALHKMASEWCLLLR